MMMLFATPVSVTRRILFVSGASFVSMASASALVAQQLGTHSITAHVQGESGPSPVTRGGALTSGLAGPLYRALQVGISGRWTTPGVELQTTVALAASSALGTGTTRPVGSFTIAKRRGAFSLSLGFEHSVAFSRMARRSDTTLSNPFDTLLTNRPRLGNSAPLISASDLVTAIGWRAGPSILSVATGLRTNDVRGGAWLGADAAVAIGQRSALTLRVRRQSQAATLRTPTFTLAVRSSYWHWGRGVPTEAVKRAAATPPRDAHIQFGSDTLILRIHAPTANRVVVAGDATEWVPAEMQRVNDGWWTIALPNTGTVSRAHMRLDEGAWQPIPGLPATRDEFGDRVSLLVPPTF